MRYDFQCPVCGAFALDVEQGMNELHVYDCECGRPMSRIFTAPMITGDLPTIRNTEYYDPTLGYITSLSDKKEKMKRRGLEYHELPSGEQALYDEARYIKKHAKREEANPAINREAASFASNEREKSVEAAIDKAVDQAAQELAHDF